jgi:hypothetical protein
MLIIDIVLTLLLCLVIFYAIVKEREELGCYRVSVGRQCDDDESVYVKNTKMLKNDTRADKIERLRSIVSYHEKGGVWKRCVLMAMISVLAVYVIYRVQPEFRFHSFLLLLLVNFTVLYFYHNYINYHHFRRLKNNANEILDTI